MFTLVYTGMTMAREGIPSVTVLVVYVVIYVGCFYGLWLAVVVDMDVYTFMYGLILSLLLVTMRLIC